MSWKLVTTDLDELLGDVRNLLCSTSHQVAGRRVVKFFREAFAENTLYRPLLASLSR